MARVFRLFEFVVGGALLCAITGLVFVAALMRFFQHPLIWSVDLAQLLFIWLCFVGAMKAMRERAHLGVDFVVRLLPHRGRLAVETGVTLVTLVFFGILVQQGIKLTLLNMERAFGDSGLSYAWVTMAVPVGSILLGIAMLSNLLEAWRAERPVLVYSRLGSSDGAHTEL